MSVGRYCSIGLCVLINLNVVLCSGQRLQQMSLSNGNVAYPENEEEDPAKQNAQNKTPVYLADLCRPGEILYPGDQLDDWVCDCKPAYVYFPAMRQCYPAYTRGPCRPGQYLILPRGSVVPQCERNPCGDGNLVWFREGCYELDKEGPCDLGTQISNVVGVNETTLELICTKDYKIDFAITRMSEDDGNKTTGNGGNDQTLTVSTTIPDAPNPILNGTIYLERRCFAGGIRWANVKCPEQHIHYDYSYNYYNKNSNNQNYPMPNSNSNRESQINQNIQDIFVAPISA